MEFQRRSVIYYNIVESKGLLCVTLNFQTYRQVWNNDVNVPTSYANAIMETSIAGSLTNFISLMHKRPRYPKNPSTRGLENHLLRTTK